MSRSQIAKGWRTLLIDMLKDSYGIAEEEARGKVDTWLRQISGEPNAHLQAPRQARVLGKTQPNAYRLSHACGQFEIRVRGTSRAPASVRPSVGFPGDSDEADGNPFRSIKDRPVTCTMLIINLRSGNGRRWIGGSGQPEGGVNAHGNSEHGRGPYE
jgi:hypothetical protein